MPVNPELQHDSGDFDPTNPPIPPEGYRYDEEPVASATSETVPGLEAYKPCDYVGEVDCYREKTIVPRFRPYDYPPFNLLDKISRPSDN